MARARKPPIDICRVRTDRLRAMTPLQLLKAQKRVGKPYEIPKREVSKTKPRWLISRFIAALRDLKPSISSEWPPVQPTSEGYDRWHRQAHGTEPDTAGPRTRVMTHEIADEYELAIWNLQQKRGCKIASEDAPARDAVREGRSSREYVDREIRRKPRARVKIR